MRRVFLLAMHIATVEADSRRLAEHESGVLLGELEAAVTSTTDAKAWWAAWAEAEAASGWAASAAAAWARASACRCAAAVVVVWWALGASAARPRVVIAPGVCAFKLGLDPLCRHDQTRKSLTKCGGAPAGLHLKPAQVLA